MQRFTRDINGFNQDPSAYINSVLISSIFVMGVIWDQSNTAHALISRNSQKKIRV